MHASSVPFTDLFLRFITMTKHIAKIFASLALTMPLLVATSACHHIDTWDNDPYGNFDALWTVLDEHYCFFADKDVDWDV